MAAVDATPLLHEQPQPPSRSVSLLRAATSTMLQTGANPGMALLQPAAPAEAGQANRLQRTDSVRANNANQMQIRVNEEVASRFWPVVLLVVVLFSAMVIPWMYFWITAAVATSNYGSKPCDVPLGCYIYMDIFAPMILGPFLVPFLGADGATARAGSKFLADTTVILVGWYWIFTSTTCAETNKPLYEPVRNLIWFNSFWTLLEIVLKRGAFWFMRTAVRRGWIQFGPKNPGCQEVIKKLPKVAHDDARLKDPQDGQPIDCTICLQELSQDTEKSVVAVPCGHCFHEECLSGWCRSHVTCPLCRFDVSTAQAAPADEKV